MIELFNLISEQRAKKINIKCDHVSYWRSESDRINNMISYIRNNFSKFQVVCFNVDYDTVMDDRYVKSFDIELYTNIETYKYLKNNYKTILEKYNKYIIDLSDVKFYSLKSYLN